jgi:hypothetical protein
MGIERQQLALKFNLTICTSLKHASNFQCLSKYIIGNLYKVQNCGDAWDGWKCRKELAFLSSRVMGVSGVPCSFTT